MFIRERRRRTRLVAGLAAAMLVVAACGSDDDGAPSGALAGDTETETDAETEIDAGTETDADTETDTDADTEARTETDADTETGTETDAGTETETDSETGTETDAETETDAGSGSSTAPDPESAEDLRIVSLSPVHTETMFAIGAGDLLVAVDENSNHPAEALEVPNDLSAFEPNVEAIAAYEPDLVLLGGDFTGLGTQLDELDIEWWDGPAAVTLDDTYAQIEQLGAVTGRVAEAAEVVAGMRTRIDEIVAEAGDAGRGLRFYHEIDDTYFSADSTTFIGQIYSLLGLENIADADESDSFGYPQLNAEFIIEQDPDLIFLATGTFYLGTADDVAARPGWDAIAAVRNGDIVETSDELAGRWGPRIVEYLEQVADAVRSVQVPAGDS